MTPEIIRIIESLGLAGALTILFFVFKLIKNFKKEKVEFIAVVIKEVITEFNKEGGILKKIDERQDAIEKQAIEDRAETMAMKEIVNQKFDLLIGEVRKTNKKLEQIHEDSIASRLEINSNSVEIRSLKEKTSNPSS